DSPYVLVLNPDTKVTAGTLDRLLELMESRPEVGMCGPRLELPDGSFDHAARRSFPTPRSALGHFTGLGRRQGASGELAAYRAPEVKAGPVDAVNGAFMLIRRSALEQVGLFDEGYWMYMEDLDLCYRFGEAGWTVWYEPEATVVHVKAGTSGTLRPLRLNYAFHYGMYRFYRAHYAERRNPLYNRIIYCGIAAKLALSAIRSAIGRLVRR
ncbi:MAG: glycosyltransferase family 2 protein, partial [Solirubrobacterales bacterium]